MYDSVCRIQCSKLFNQGCKNTDKTQCARSYIFEKLTGYRLMCGVYGMVKTAGLADQEDVKGLLPGEWIKL